MCLGGRDDGIYMDRDASLLPSGGPQCQVLGRSLVSSFVKREDVVDVVLFHPRL